eukprot:CAMPEP_0176206068 /NCGR_PEP_ID=MMETSP0121_2-20121125/11918_1 /TAXON_ID=160619 /ORGANISM="Kryptoperidinium foliaceum, Strain CCMP 1326" /LENGTH=247 /DNA_ID=CAMNT_0017545019 /DNA_START=340 /DNA_END=1084 /DNA_ORIENTATION=-
MSDSSCVVHEGAAVVEGPIWGQMQHCGYVAGVLHATGLHEGHVVVGLDEVALLVPAALKHGGLTDERLKATKIGSSAGASSRAAPENLCEAEPEPSERSPMSVPAVASCHRSSGKARNTVRAASATGPGKMSRATTMAGTAAPAAPRVDRKAIAREPTIMLRSPARLATLFLLSRLLPQRAIKRSAARTSFSDGAAANEFSSADDSNSSGKISPLARASARSMAVAAGSAIACAGAGCCATLEGGSM